MKQHQLSLSKSFQPFIFFICIASLMIGCDKSANKEQPLKDFVLVPRPDFTYEGDTTKIQRILRPDIDKDGYDDVIVLFGKNINSKNNFDSLKVYHFNPATNSYRQSPRYKFERGERVELKSVTNDTIPEVLVYTDEGGTSLTDSRGLVIIGLMPEGFSILRSYEGGNPKLVSFHLDSVRALAISSDFTKGTSRSEVIPFVDSLDFIAPVDQSTKKQYEDKYFLDLVTLKYREYVNSKSLLQQNKNSNSSKLYRFAIEYLLYQTKLNNQDKIDQFLQQEKSFLLSVLPNAQVELILAFSSKK